MKPVFLDPGLVKQWVVRSFPEVAQEVVLPQITKAYPGFSLLTIMISNSWHFTLVYPIYQLVISR